MTELDRHAERGDLEGLTRLDRSPENEGIDLVAVRAWRQPRVRAEMTARGVDAVILSDPVSIRYATGARQNGDCVETRLLDAGECTNPRT